MKKRKSLREHGKIKFSQYFQEFENGTSVAVIREHLLNPKFPKQIHGRTGKIIGKRGNYFIVKINDLKKEKDYIINPVHLKKITLKKI
jgi:large subunit ribosomal protein L21e